MGDMNITKEVLEIRWKAYEEKRKERIRVVMEERKKIIDEKTKGLEFKDIFGSPTASASQLQTTKASKKSKKPDKTFITQGGRARSNQKLRSDRPSPRAVGKFSLGMIPKIETEALLLKEEKI